MRRTLRDKTPVRLTVILDLIQPVTLSQVRPRPERPPWALLAWISGWSNTTSTFPLLPAPTVSLNTSEQKYFLPRSPLLTLWLIPDTLLVMLTRCLSHPETSSDPTPSWSRAGGQERSSSLSTTRGRGSGESFLPTTSVASANFQHHQLNTSVYF